MDTQTIFLAQLATAQGVRSGLVKITLTEDEDWGDEYIATCQISGSPEEQLYKGETAGAAHAVVQHIIAERELLVSRSARSIAGVAVSEIIPTKVMIDFNS